MPTRRQTNGATLARNAHPRLRLSAAPLRQHSHASLRRATDAGRSLDLRTVYRQFVRRLWFAAS
ncbi:MAG: hypothetical protein F4X11_13275 [Acidobacteria bacterium]|nr:hypothetical protein [Acidobacteriota bacterium]